MADPPPKETLTATIDEADGQAADATGGATRLDRYDFGPEVARGGMGRVREAYDRLLQRPVAVKELLGGTPLQRARFEREARITARLQHPSIVPVYDAGALSGAGPFYCMKLVSGRSLDELITEAGTLAKRLALLPHVLAAVEALAYAHSQGIIHRDLKPLNILVGTFGETVVIDWGLAKDVRQQAPEDEPDASWEGGDKLTLYGAVIGTPAYMPSEQAAGKPVDAHADVYALGAILYHLIAGEPPFCGGDSKKIVARVAGGPAPALPGDVGIPDDLRAIVEKAMAFDAAERYPTAQGLADDLKRFQTGQLVGAYTYSLMTLVVRWLRRHRRLAVVTGALVAALAATAVVSFRRIVAERDRAEAARRELESRENELVLLQAESALARDPTATLAWLKRYHPEPGKAWAARALAEEAVGRGVARYVFPLAAPSRALAASPSDDIVAVGEDDGAVEVFDLRSGRRRTLGRHAGGAGVVAFAPDGRLASGGADGTVRVWDPRSAETRALTGHTAAVRSVVWSPDGRRLASGDDAGVMMLWDLAAGTGHAVAHHRLAVSALAFSLDGTRLVSASADGSIASLQLADGHSTRVEAHRGEVLRLAFLPDGRLASTGEDNTVRLWDVETGTGRIIGNHDDWIPGLAVAPDGSVVATSSGDATIKLWDPAGGPVRVLRGHTQTVPH